MRRDALCRSENDEKCAEIDVLHLVIISRKKSLTNHVKGDRIYELSRRAGARYHEEVGRREKKSKKLLKNPLTKAEERGTIYKLSPRGGSDP